MANKRQTVLIGIVLLFVAGLGVAVLIWHSGAGSRTAAAIRYWTRSDDDPATRGLPWGARRRLAKESIQRLGPKAIPALRRELRCDPIYDKFYRRIINRAPAAARWMPRPFVYPGDPGLIRARAAWILGLLKSEARAAVPDLVDQSRDRHPQVRMAVATALGSIGLDTPRVRNALEQLAADLNPQTSLAATVSLWQLQPQQPGLADRIGALLRNNQLPFSTLCLRRLGPAGRPLAPMIDQVISEMAWSHFRMELVHVLWDFTGDKQRVLEQFRGLGDALADQLSRVPVPGWTPCEQALAYAVKYELAGVPEFRDALRPLLRELIRSKAVVANPNAPSDYWASRYLAILDGKDALVPGQAPPAPSPDSAPHP